jgi:Fic family protein
MSTSSFPDEPEMHNTYEHICFQRRWTLTAQHWFLLGESNALITAIKNTAIRPDFRKHLYSVALIKGAVATTAIEGNTLTEEQVRALREGEAELPESREYLQTEVDNVIDALNTILQELIQHRDVLITPELIRRFHQMIGKHIGVAFAATPGAFRRNNVTVGPYRAPRSEEIPDLVDKLCQWLRREFHYEQGQSFIDAAIQAIVTHVYIAWIHPFADGNGRTARLIEFFLLVRSGVPDIASHVLSNHYNLTRSEYYRHIDQAMRKNDLSDFLLYAIQGFRDGLQGVLEVIQENQRQITWNNYIYDVYDHWIDEQNQQRPAAKRKRNLIRRMPTDDWQTVEEILNNHSSIFRDYGGDEKSKTLLRDLADLVKDGLLVRDKKRYKANLEILRAFMAQSAAD